MTSEIVNRFFAWAPLVGLLIVFVILYLATRKESEKGPATLGKTYACAQCGRRGSHEHMLPSTREGAVVWYCARCAH